ncbi:MAG: type I methionyl aminopeptidase [Candidatus Andersenbacteria bacterium]
MISLKTPQEIETLAEAGALLGTILDELVSRAKSGVTGKELDIRARELITQAGAVPAFLNYAPKGHKPFPAALCVSVNDGIVHGLPNDTPFADGDVVGLDLGLVLKGMYVDHARTVGIGTVSDEVKLLMAVTKQALERGIAAAQVSNTTGDIGHAVQEFIEAEGFSVVRQLVGHGVGHAVHEEPQVPNFGRAGTGTTLQAGLVIAIEPMVTIGDPEVTTGDDGWTVVTADGSLSAHEEHTVAVTENGPRILTNGK